MAKHKPLYRGSFNEAVRLGETELWRASWHENIACRDYISQSIALNYDRMRLGGDVAGQAIAKFGYDRVNWLLANTIRLKDHDGRFSAENKEWAKGFFYEADDIHRHDFVIDDAHPGLVDLVVRQAREAYDRLNLFGAKQCISVFEYQDVTGHVLVLKPETLKDDFKTPECQLFLPSHGNGCRPNAIGRSIFGKFLIDGEQARYWRQDFLGVLKPELLPEWAIEKMAEPEPEQKPMHIKVFQISQDRDTEGSCYETLEPGQAVDPSIYDEVFDGEVDCADLGAVFQLFHNRPPDGYRGREMDTGDVVQVLRCDTEFYGKIRWYIAPELYEDCSYYDQWAFEHALEEAREYGSCIEVERLADQHVPAAAPGCYYLGPEDFEPVAFDAEQAQVAVEDFAAEEAQADMGITFYG